MKKNISENIIFVLTALFLSRLFTAICCLMCSHHLFYYGDFSKWDAGLYIEIAQRGYTLISCAELVGKSNPEQWCGNSGWMPFYPYLIKMVSFTGLDIRLSGFLISLFFQSATLYLIADFFLAETKQLKKLLILVCCTLFFGGIYYQAVFPVSMFLFFMMIHLYFLIRDKLFKACLFGAAAAFTYPSALWIAIVTPLFLFLYNFKKINKNVITQIFFCCFSICLGFGLMMLIQKMQTGRWNAFFLVQDKYGHGINIPTKYIRKNFETLLELKHFQFKNWIDIQTNCVLFYFIFCLILVFAKRKYFFSETNKPLSLFLLLYLLVFYLFPLSMGHSLSLYRAESLLMPSVLLLRNTSYVFILLFILILATIAFFMNQLFFLNILV